VNKMNYSVRTDLEISVKGQDLKIEIYADLDGDYVPTDIQLEWYNEETKKQRELPPLLKDFVEKKFDFEIHMAIAAANIDYDDTAYDLQKESF
tara:strand:+ start:793 stop:1071 length:279 start_codon:yes stop_codon:yes gene_type:complete